MGATLNELVSVPQVSGPRAAVLEFRGQGGEYFRIWIVNLLLKIVTLGIYSAWAKVRTKRYFYGSTLLEGAAFEYHATPIQILKGRLIAAALIAVNSLAGHFLPWLAVALTIAYLLLAPWVVNMSLRFNARMSSYRNVRFDFQGTYWRAFLVLFVLPVASALTLWILAPVWHRAVARYLAQGYRFGGRPFAADPPLGRLYVIYLQAFGLLMLFAAILLGTMFLDVPHPGEPQGDGASWRFLVFMVLPIVLLVPFQLLLLAFIRAKGRNLVFAGLTLDGRHRFASGLSPWGYAWIVIGNLAATLLTLGLFAPFAQIRSARYTAERTAVYPASDLSEFLAGLPADPNAFGSEFSDLVGLEIGI